ncbi:MAG: energy transducer TonB [Terracidiphilus sp.]
MPEYERLEDEALPVETQAGGVKHNGSTDLETRTPPFGRQTRHREAIEPDATMANDLLDPITESQTAADPSDGCELDVAFGAPVQEIPLWVDLYESIRDIFFPPKLPPLELTSRPIPVPDRMAVKRNPWAFGISATFNIGIAALAVFLGINTYINNAKPKMQVTPIDVEDWKAPKAVVVAGGGGGSPDKMEAIKGKIPPRAEQIVAPKVDEPPVPTIDVQPDIIIPDNLKLTNFGQTNSTNIKLVSSGNGSGIGIGSGHGDGYGPGSGWNTGGGLARVGGAVSAPVPIYDPDPEFSDEARRAKYQGVVLVGLIVDAQGNPQNVHIVRPLGMGLDEKALEAVRTYKFKPAYDREHKKTVAVMVNIEVNFHLY